MNILQIEVNVILQWFQLGLFLHSLFSIFRCQNQNSKLFQKEAKAPRILQKTMHFIQYSKAKPSLQIIFAYRRVICQARGQFWPDKKPVWPDKNTNQYEEVKSVSERAIYWHIWTHLNLFLKLAFRWHEFELRKIKIFLGNKSRWSFSLFPSRLIFLVVFVFPFMI